MCSHSSRFQIPRKISRPNIRRGELPQQWRKMGLTGCEDRREAGAACMPQEVTIGPFLCPHPMASNLFFTRALPVAPVSWTLYTEKDKKLAGFLPWKLRKEKRTPKSKTKILPWYPAASQSQNPQRWSQDLRREGKNHMKVSAKSFNRSASKQGTSNRPTSCWLFQEH